MKQPVSIFISGGEKMRNVMFGRASTLFTFRYLQAVHW